MPTVFIDESGRYKLVKIEQPPENQASPASTKKATIPINEKAQKRRLIAFLVLTGLIFFIAFVLPLIQGK